jgi:hypothetical protein
LRQLKAEAARAPFPAANFIFDKETPHGN